MNPALGAYLLGIGVGLITGGFAVALIWSRAINTATTLPDPRADTTERISHQPIDLPRRGTHFEEYA